jgi:hypothetical protein
MAKKAKFFPLALTEVEILFGLGFSPQRLLHNTFIFIGVQ